MAEVFGVVGSAVGVAGFAFQIADGIKKLADFCHAVKDAPTDLQDALLELADLAELYEEIGQQIQDQQTTNYMALPSRTVLDKLLQRSKRNHKDLHTLLADLEAEVKKRQTRGSIRAVLKKETFARFQKRVERTKDTLQISYAVYSNALICQEAHHTRVEIQKISAVTPRISTIANQVSTMELQVGVLITQSSSIMSSTTRMIDHSPQTSKTNTQRQQKHRNTVTYRFGLPIWLHNRVYELAYSYSTNVWTTQFRVYNKVSFSSPFLMACYNLDYDKVKNMLLIEPAHVFDQDEYGQTALHHAALGLRWIQPNSLNLMKLLVEAGADVLQRSSPRWVHGSTPSDIFVTSGSARELGWDANATSREILNLLQFAASIQDKDGLELERGSYLGSVPPGSSSMKLIQVNMDPPWSTRSLESRVSYVAGCLFGLSHQLRTRHDFEAILGSKLTSAVWEVDKGAGCNLFLNVMHAFGRTIRHGTTEEIDQWREVLQQAVSSGVSLIQASPYLDTDNVNKPLEGFLRGFIYPFSDLSCEHDNFDEDPEQICQTAITRLATELQHAGLDLTEYGQQAESTLRNACLLAWSWHNWFGDSDPGHFRVLKLQHGPKPEDWHLLLSDVYSEYLDACHGEFWDLVEHPERRIPGAWDLDEAEDFRRWDMYRRGSRYCDMDEV